MDAAPRWQLASGALRACVVLALACLMLVGAAALVAAPADAAVNWAAYSPLDSARAAMSLPLADFLAEADSPGHDPRLDWSSDGCSTPLPHLPGADTFTPACRRHDFGYHNFGERLALAKTEDVKAAVDGIFHDDMDAICALQSGPRQVTCLAQAETFFLAVRDTFPAHDKFFAADPAAAAAQVQQNTLGLLSTGVDAVLGWFG